MNLSFLKFNRNAMPENSSLRPLIFNVNLYWFLILLASLFIFIFGAALGFKLFSTLYLESYKKDTSNLSASDLLDIKRLEINIENRNKFILSPRKIPTDPSL